MSTLVPHHKTTFIAYIASSIDGRISLTKKSLPRWTSKEDWAFFQKSIAAADAVVVGRNTYKAAADRLRKRRTYVFSSRISSMRRQGAVTFLNPAHVDLSELFGGYRKVAILGGGGIYRFMLEKNLCDELYITIEPLVFGRGKQMVTGGTKTQSLHLRSFKKLNKKGSLLLHYTTL